MTVTRFKKHNKRKASRKLKGAASRSKVHSNKKNSSLRKNGKSMRDFKQMGGVVTNERTKHNEQQQFLSPHVSIPVIYNTGTTRRNLKNSGKVKKGIQFFTTNKSTETATEDEQFDMPHPYVKIKETNRQNIVDDLQKFRTTQAIQGDKVLVNHATGVAFTVPIDSTNPAQPPTLPPPYYSLHLPM